MKPARVTHSLGRDAEGLMLNLVQAGQVFLLQRQGRSGAAPMTIQLTAEHIRDMAAVAGR